MRLLLDENMSDRRLGARLRAQGHDPVLATGVGLLSATDARVFRRPAGRDLPGIELPHLCDMIRACSHSCRCLYTGEENRHGRVHRVL